jgi:hypothetical protein
LSPSHLSLDRCKRAIGDSFGQHDSDELH